MTLFRKNVTLRNYSDFRKIKLEPGLEAKHRLSDNNEDYVSLMGTKPQINRYLQEANIISERLRTLNDLPKMRIINTKVERIQ
jgi:hypothetical protein